MKAHARALSSLSGQFSCPLSNLNLIYLCFIVYSHATSPPPSPLPLPLMLALLSLRHSSLSRRPCPLRHAPHLYVFPSTIRSLTITPSA